VAPRERSFAANVRSPPFPGEFAGYATIRGHRIAGWSFTSLRDEAHQSPVKISQAVDRESDLGVIE